MKTIENNSDVNYLCKLCLGCNKLEEKEFAGVIRCKNFVAGREGWYEEYMKGMRGNEK